MAAKGLWPVLNVGNVDKSVEFYAGLGLKAKTYPMDMPGMPHATMGMIDGGEWGLIIMDKHNIPPGQAADTQAWLSGEMGKGVLFTIGVRDAKKVWANAQKMRANVDQPLGAQPWGGHGFNVVDPDGYVWNITDKFPSMEPPKAKKRPTAARKAKAKPKRKGR